MRYLLAALITLAGCIPATMMTQTSTQSPITPASTVKAEPIRTGPITIQTQTGGAEPTQLGAHQIEVRRLEVPYDVAYGAATQAMSTLGYTIIHSDKVSGILTGSRMVGVQTQKQEIAQKKSEIKEKQKKAEEMDSMGWLPYVGWAYSLEANKIRKSMPDLSEINEPKELNITMILKSLDEKSTRIRFTMLIDGEPAWDTVVIDKLWVTTEREAMIEEGPSTAQVSDAKSQITQTTAQTNTVYATKDSGIFHRRSCSKIAHLLVGKELIEFSSPEAALKAGGSPCDACKPQSSK